MSCRNGVYSLLICQVAIMGGMVLCFPSVKVETFIYDPKVSNGTLHMGECGVTHPYKIVLALPCIAASVAAAAFASTTFNLIETDQFPRGDYTKLEMETLGIWQGLYWFVVSMFHIVCVFAITSPVNLFAGGACAYLMVHFLHQLCAPQVEHVHFSHSGTNIVGYMGGFLLMFYCVPPSVYSSRVAVGFIVGLLDYLMWIGHTWDKAPTLETVTTCRLTWSCCSCIVLAGLYGAWHDTLLNPHLIDYE